MPHAPICVLLTSGRPASQLNIARSSEISFGPAIVPTVASWSFEPPSPCRKITAGQPPAGAVPSGLYRS
jgi:hypothetical protein